MAPRDIVGFVLVDRRTVTAIAWPPVDDELVALVELDHDAVLDVYEQKNYVRPKFDRARLQLQSQLFDDGSGIMDLLRYLGRRSGLPEPDGSA